MTLFERIRRFDAYAKTADDFRTQTFTGGLVTLASVVLIAVLSLAAIADYLQIRWKSEVKIDQNRDTDRKIMVSFDITFPRLPCFALTLDVMDGPTHMDNVVENVIKTRLGNDGRVIGKYEEVSRALRNDPNYCGSCYSNNDLNDPAHADLVKEDAQNKAKGICCNSCSSVFAAYAARRQPMPVLDHVEQCVKEGWVERLREAKDGEGCRAKGSFLVDHASSGDFHFAPGESFEAQVGGRQVHVHDLRFFKDIHFDFSHTITELRFGDLVPTQLRSKLSEPLSGASVESTDKKVEFSYFVKVVASEFRLFNRKTLRTFQYSATRHKKTLGAEDGASFPGLVVRFEVSPMVVVNSEYRRSFTSLITTLTAILGGIYTLAALFDAMFYYAERRLLEKKGLGKAN